MTQVMTYFGLPITDCGLKKVRAVSIRNLQSAIRNLARASRLLELIVAMSLMVVVSSCLYTALYTGFRAYRSARPRWTPRPRRST